MYITYFKDTGEITSPIISCDRAIAMEEVYGEEKAKIYSKIYDYINIKDNNDIICNPKKYCIDIETKKLKICQVKENDIPVEYL